MNVVGKEYEPYWSDYDFDQNSRGCYYFFGKPTFNFGFSSGISRLKINQGWTMTDYELFEEDNGHLYSKFSQDESTDGMKQTTLEIYKDLNIDWKVQNVNLKNAVTRSYIVMLRLDPRFSHPQVFIFKFNKLSKTYEGDVPWQGEQKNLFQKCGESDSFEQCQKYLTSFFAQYYSQDTTNINDNYNINVKKDEIVSIRLLNSYEFNSLAKINNNIDSNFKISHSISHNEELKNNIPEISKVTDYEYFSTYLPSVTNNNYLPLNALVASSEVMCVNKTLNRLFGIADCDLSIIPDCNVSEDTKCKYVKGHGLKILIGQDIIEPKSWPQIYNGNIIFQYTSNSDGNIVFDVNANIQEVYNQSNLKIVDWNFEGFPNNVSQKLKNTSTSLYGRYIMHVDVTTIPTKALVDIDNLVKLEYKVAKSGENIDRYSGTEIPTSGDITLQLDDVDKNDSRLYIRAISNNQNVEGEVIAMWSGYQGVKKISGILQYFLVDLVLSKYQQAMKTLYLNIIHNDSFLSIVNVIFILYISIFGLYLLLGGVEFKVYDLVMRSIKITFVVAALNSEIGYEFYHDTFFQAIYKGATNLVAAVSKSGDKDNLFAFLDPILGFYISGKYWAGILGQFLSISNGGFLLGIINIVSTIIFLKALLVIILEYVMSLVFIYVFLSVAPIFILFLLFKFTQDMFRQWCAILITFMLRPMLLLILFFMLYDIILYSIQSSNNGACIGTWFTIPSYKVTIWDIVIPIVFKVTIPGLIMPKVEFTSVIVSSLLYFCFARAVAGLQPYVNALLGVLTGAELQSLTGAKSDRYR